MKNRFSRLLTWIEFHARTDVRYILRGGFWVGLNYGIQICIGLILTVALANLLEKDQLGIYHFVLAVAGVLSLFTLSGLGPAVIRAVAQGNHGILPSAVRLKLLWSIGIVLSSGAVSLYYFVNGDITLGTAFLIVGLTAPLIESFNLYEPYLHGREAFRDNLTLGFWRKPLPLVAVTLTAYLSNDVLHVIAAYFISNTIAYFLVYRMVRKKYNVQGSTDIATITLGKHLSFLASISKASTYVDKILVWHFLGPVAVASFTIAQLSSRYTGTLLNAFGALVLPKVARRDLSTLQQTLPRKIMVATLFMALGATVYIAIAPFIFPVLFPNYPESVLISQLLALSIILVPRGFYTKVLIAHNQIHSQYWLDLTTTLVRLVSLTTLIYFFDIYGAVAALLLTDLFNAGLSWMLFRQAKSH